MTPLSIVQGILDRNEGATLKGILYVRPEPKKEAPTLKDFDPWCFRKAQKYDYAKTPVYDNAFDVKYTPGKKNLEYEYQTALLNCVSSAFLSKDQEARAEYGFFTDLGNCIVPCVDLENDIAFFQAAHAAATIERLYEKIMGREAKSYLFQTGNSYHVYLNSELKNRSAMVDSVSDWYHGLNSLVPYVDRKWTQMLVNTKGKSGILRISAGQNNRKVPVYIS